MLEEFGDFDDIETIKKSMNILRESYDPLKKRQGVLTRVKDVVEHRLEKDIMAGSISDGSVL